MIEYLLSPSITTTPLMLLITSLLYVASLLLLIIAIRSIIKVLKLICEDLNNLTHSIKLYNSNLTVVNNKMDNVTETLDEINSNLSSILKENIKESEYVHDLKSPIENNSENRVLVPVEDYTSTFEYKITSDFIEYILNIDRTLDDFPVSTIQGLAISEINNLNIFKIIKTLDKDRKDIAIKFITSTKIVNEFLDSRNYDNVIYFYKRGDKEACQWSIINGLYNIENYNINKENQIVIKYKDTIDCAITKDFIEFIDFYSSVDIFSNLPIINKFESLGITELNSHNIFSKIATTSNEKLKKDLIDAITDDSVLEKFIKYKEKVDIVIKNTFQSTIELNPYNVRNIVVSGLTFYLNELL